MSLAVDTALRGRTLGRSVSLRRFAHLASALLGCGIAFSGMAAAQNVLQHHDGTTEFLDHGTLTTAQSGWLCDRWMIEDYLGGIRSITAYSVIVQDQNCATGETMQFGLFGEALGAGGQRTGTPRETQPIGLTIIFSGPGCGPGQTNGPAGWIYRISGAGTAPVAPGPFTTDVFTASFLEADAQWPNGDGLAGVASIAGITQGVNPEQPSPRMLAAFNAVTSGWPRDIQRCDFVSGSGGGTAGTRYGTVYCSGDELELSSSAAQIGSRDTNNTWSLLTSIGPDNYGFAGRFPDPRNLNGTTPQRFDSPLFQVTHSTAVPSGLSLVLLAESLAITTFGQQFDLPGVGLLALDPSSQLFGISAGGLPGLIGPIAGPTSNFLIDLTAMQARAAFQPGQRFFAQVLDIDLSTGAAGLSNLMSWEIF